MALTKVNQTRSGTGPGNLFGSLGLINEGLEGHILNEDVVTDPGGQRFEHLISQARFALPAVLNAQIVHEAGKVPMFVLVDFRLRKSKCCDDPLLAREVEASVGAERVQDGFYHGAGFLTVLDAAQQADNADKAAVI